MHHFPEEVTQLEEERKYYHKEWRVVHFHGLLLSYAFENGEAKQGRKEKE